MQPLPPHPLLHRPQLPSARALAAAKQETPRPARIHASGARPPHFPFLKYKGWATTALPPNSAKLERRRPDPAPAKVPGSSSPSSPSNFSLAYLLPREKNGVPGAGERGSDEVAGVALVLVLQLFRMDAGGSSRASSWDGRAWHRRPDLDDGYQDVEVV
jgi:hypothetical protein